MWVKIPAKMEKPALRPKILFSGAALLWFDIQPNKGKFAPQWQKNFHSQNTKEKEKCPF
jgi:hypothetical protein